MTSKYPYGPPRHKVALLGASGGIGQPLALLLKTSAMVSDLALYDIKQAAVPSVGVAADVSHISTASKVSAFAGDEELEACLKGASVTIITAGVPRKPGMSRDDLFAINAKIVKGLAEATAKYAPKSMVLIITNPVNSTVPIVCEVFKQAGVFDWRKIVGVTTLDCVRASTFVAEIAGTNPIYTTVPVVGGHAAETILPLISQTDPMVNLTQPQIEALDKRIQEAGTEVVEAKGGAGSATLSMAYAAKKFAEACLLGLSGVKQVECCFFNSESVGIDMPYFAAKAELGPMGIMQMVPLGKLSAYESQRLEQAKKKLKSDIAAGVEFANKK